MRAKQLLRYRPLSRESYLGSLNVVDVLGHLLLRQVVKQNLVVELSQLNTGLVLHLILSQVGYALLVQSDHLRHGRLIGALRLLS